MTPEQAEDVAIRALGWLAGNEDLCPVFLASTGAAAEDLRALARVPAFLASVLEFVTMDDAWVVAFCDTQGLPYEAPLRARHALPGAEQVHWT
ncbi:DUF3572 domain-containing protein [Salibaculum halophilum]|uniref:DUF3572 domain-containing protein n=1 Tax=Salibaculum halophilum TaxID=1914408 RepID=UPI000A11D5AD|nr:DUF3572 domain-containing protein [Salibaculum halophilum]